jgi:hypothetical protein
VDNVGPAIEEYKSLRQESLDALARQQTIAQYGLAAVGVVIGIGIVAEERNRTALAVVMLMVLVPLLALFGAQMLAVEAQRVARAGWYLRGLEGRINSRLPPDVEPLGWETLLATDTRYRVQGYIEVIAIVIAVTAVISVGIGGYLLAKEDRWVWLAGAVAADATLLAAFGWWVRRTWKRLKWFSEAAPDARPFAHPAQGKS